MKKTFLILLVLSLLSVHAFASSKYTFQDYKWGTHIEDIKTEIAPDKQMIAWETEISYNDSIFDSLCKVTLAFTPEEKLLYKISVYWNNDEDRAHVLGFGESIRNWINSKFGTPTDMIGSKNEYVWGGQDNASRIELFYLYPTRLIYYGGKYYEQFLEENITTSDSGNMKFGANSEEIVT